MSEPPEIVVHYAPARRPDEMGWTSSDSRVPGFRCGHCGEAVTADLIASNTRGGNSRWVHCPGCEHGSVIEHPRQYPAPGGGAEVPHLPEAVKAVHDEARIAFGAGCFAACELVCRRLLIFLAVDREAIDWKRNRSFDEYIDALATAGHLTPAMRGWAERIKRRGNRTTHELETVSEAQASETLRLTTLLLRNVYEMGDPPED